MYDGWLIAMETIQESVIQNGGFAWQFFNEQQTPNQTECLSFYRAACAPTSEFQTDAIMYQYALGADGAFLNFTQDLSSFLLTRGPYAWLGYAWLSCSYNWQFPDALYVDYGVPLGVCAETVPGQSGVFTRQWTNATVSIDCNSFDFDLRLHS